jgi:hypothetical protein
MLHAISGTGKQELRAAAFTGAHQFLSSENRSILPAFQPHPNFGGACFSPNSTAIPSVGLRNTRAKKSRRQHTRRHRHEKPSHLLIRKHRRKKKPNPKTPTSLATKSQL